MSPWEAFERAAHWHAELRDFTRPGDQFTWFPKTCSSPRPTVGCSVLSKVTFENLVEVNVITDDNDRTLRRMTHDDLAHWHDKPWTTVCSSSFLVATCSSTNSVANFDDVSSCSSQTADDASSCQDDTLVHCLHWSSLVEDPLLSPMLHPADDLPEAGSEHVDNNSDEAPLLPHEDVPSP